MKPKWLIPLCLMFLLIACSFPLLSSGGEDEVEEVNTEDYSEEEINGQPLALEGGEPLDLNCEGGLMESAFDLQVYQTPDLPEPDPHQSFRDPVFGSCLVRVTDRDEDPMGDDPSRGLKNEYSRVQSFNADSSLLVVRSIEAFWYLYAAHSLQLLDELPVSTEPRWDSQDPHLLYDFDESRLLAYHLDTGVVESVHDFNQDFPGENLSAVWTRYEGSPSFDTRYWGLMAQDENWDTIALLVYDLQNDTLVGKRMLPDKPSIDAVSISPLGNYLLVYHDEYCEEGELGSLEQPCGLMVYDRDLQHGRSLLRIIGHSDTALDAEGREVLIYQDIDTDTISMLDLESGEVTPLVPIDFSHSAIGLHFSGRAQDKPGWALVSTHNGSYPQNRTWMDDVIFAIELKANPRIIRLAHTHSLFNEEIEHDYWAEPQASASPDFSQVLFTSNWGRSGTEEVEMYLINLPPNWSDAAPE
jgi:hypothetical protein